MESWTGHEVPRLPGSGARRWRCTTRRGSGVHPSDAGRRRDDVRLRHHPVRRDPPRPRRHHDHVRPGATGSGATPATTVRYVQNVTDIDDPLLERAARDGEDWMVLAMRETALFREDMEALRIIPPAHYVGAVESIPAIAEQVAALLERRRGVPARRRHRRRLLRHRRRAPVRLRVATCPASTMLELFGRARRRPGPGRQARPARPAAVARRPRGRAGLGRRRARPGPPRLAHRVRGHRAGPARRHASTCRAAATTCSSRTTSAPPRTPRCSPARRRSPRTTCTPA